MKRIFFMFFVLLVSGAIFCIEPDFKDLNIEIGNVRIDQPFVHADKDYEKGIYWITLTAKEGVPYFNICNQKKELLFEEMAIVKPYESKRKNFKYQVIKGFLRGQEFYRIKVKRPDSILLAYFLVKKQEEPKKEEPKKEDDQKL